MADESADPNRESRLVTAAASLAHALGEREREPLRQLRRLLRFCGLEFADGLLGEARTIESADGIATKDGNRRRTFGGVFFRLARDRLYSSDRMAFYRVFQPPRSKPRTPRWEERPGGGRVTAGGRGEITNVKITLTGRPDQVSQGQGYVVLAMASRKPPSLPRGMPSPPPRPTTYDVYVTDKQWRRVGSSVMDPKDFLIVEGYPHLDSDHGAIAVFANRVTTKSLEEAAKKTS